MNKKEGGEEKRKKRGRRKEEDMKEDNQTPELVSNTTVQNHRGICGLKVFNTDTRYAKL